MKEFKYEIVKNIAVLKKTKARYMECQKELNIISFNGKIPVYDIRTWDVTDGERKMLKGISLDKEELKALKEALEGLEI